MEVVTSKIKTMFHPELLRYIAAICDTRRIESNNEKMIVLCDLLYSHDIKFEILGGATNRIALQIDGYAVKFAMDEQGYLDNLIEYSLSPELQPYVTKSYETNGYIQVQELVEVMTKESFKVYKVEIYKVLDTLCQDYLLGDVGYIDKNRTNWGIRGGHPVILDYAYCHRATENLFTCSKCGAPLKYDSTYDKLMCSDRSACKTIYTYNERKRIQGKKVDEDMVKERKAESIKLSGTDVSREIEMFEDRLVGDNYFIIDCPADMHRYNKLKEALTMQVSINGGEENMTTLEERFAAMVDLAKNPEDAKAREIVESSASEELPNPIYTDNYQERYMYGGAGFGLRMYDLHESDEEEYDSREDEEQEEEIDPEDALSAMIDRISSTRRQVTEDYERRSAEQVNEYLQRKKNEGASVEKASEPEPEKEGATSKEPVREPDDSSEGIDAAAEEESLRELHTSPEKEDEEEDYQTENPEDAAVLVNGKPLPIGEEVTV